MLVSGQSIYVGSSSISKVYQGDDLIWPSTPPTPTPVVTGEGYYYWYKSSTNESIDTIVANFDSLKQQGTFSSASTTFSFDAYGDKTRTTVCIAIPQPKGLKSVIATGSTQMDITSLFYENDPKDITIDGISYRLYYKSALWPSNMYSVTADTSMEYLTLDIVSGGTITWVVGNSTGPQKTIYYSKNNGEWTPITSSYTNAPILMLIGGIYYDSREIHTGREMDFRILAAILVSWALRHILMCTEILTVLQIQ